MLTETHTKSAKIHLIPIAGGMKYAICSTRIRDGGRLAVHTRKEFNALPRDERCLRCDAVLNGRGVV